MAIPRWQPGGQASSQDSRPVRAASPRASSTVTGPGGPAAPASGPSAEAAPESEEASGPESAPGPEAAAWRSSAPGPPPPEPEPPEPEPPEPEPPEPEPSWLVSSPRRHSTTIMPGPRLAASASVGRRRDTTVRSRRGKTSSGRTDRPKMPYQRSSSPR